MSLTTYCSPDEIRSALGVGDVELEDTVLLAPLYESSLKLEISKVATGARQAYLQALTATSPTELQTSLVEATQVFSTYAVARRAGAALGMLAPKDLHDDKSGFSRFADGPYKDTLARLEVLYAMAREDLKLAYAALSGTTVTTASPATVFLASSRSYDPVAGE